MDIDGRLKAEYGKETFKHGHTRLVLQLEKSAGRDFGKTAYRKNDRHTDDPFRSSTQDRPAVWYKIK